MNNLLSEYLRYRKSKYKQTYKEIGKQYRVSGFYVSRIAHGHDMEGEFDEDIRFDLNFSNTEPTELTEINLMKFVVKNKNLAE